MSSRAERLLRLMQLLRRQRRAVGGAALAAGLGVSARTLYRDIASLRAGGARIDGEAGVGYLLRPGSDLPPLMFSIEEVEALALGLRWVAERADPGLGEAARDALAKVAAVLPAERRRELETQALLVGPAGDDGAAGGAELARLREAIRHGRKVELVYRDAAGGESARTVWPFALGYFERVRVVVAWCELRAAFRHFRTDRIAALAVSELRYPRPREALLGEWRRREGLAAS